MPKACGGTGTGAMPSRRSLHEGKLIDLTQCRSPGEDHLERRLAKEDHAFLLGGALDLGGRPPLEDQLADVVGKVEQLGDGEPPQEAGAVALDAAAPLPVDLVGVAPRVEAALLEELRRGAHRL